jgi:hypothetical protein
VGEGAQYRQQMDRVVASARRKAMESVHSKLVLQAARIIERDTVATQQLQRVQQQRQKLEERLAISAQNTVLKGGRERRPSLSGILSRANSRVTTSNASQGTRGR